MVLFPEAPGPAKPYRWCWGSEAWGSSTSRGKVNTKTSRVILRSLKGTRPPTGGPSRLESTWAVRKVKLGVPGCPGKSIASQVLSDTKSFS